MKASLYRQFSFIRKLLETNILTKTISFVNCRNELVSLRKFSHFQQKELSILFFGSDEFSLSSLKLLHQKFIYPRSSSMTIIKNLQVVTTKINNPVSLFCQKVDLPVHYFDDYIVPNNYFDLGVISSFGRLITSNVIESCKYGKLAISFQYQSF